MSNLTLNIESAFDKESLLSKLQGTSIYVPGRTDGRKTEHTEKWTLASLLATLAEENFCTYPLKLRHTDSPDFILSMNSQDIGIEVTEAVPPDYAKCCAIRDREYPGAQIDMSLFKWGSQPKKTEELRGILEREKLTGAGWEGYSVEDEWACFMDDAINTKLKKLNSGNYAQLEEYWISIYDNLPLPNVFAKRATTALYNKLKRSTGNVKTFSHVFIERGPIIIAITSGGVNHYVRNDLWP